MSEVAAIMLLYEHTIIKDIIIYISKYLLLLLFNNLT